MASVTFPVEFGGSGITITDDADPTTGLDGTGYIDRFVPALQQGLAMTGHAVQKASEANQSATTASEAAQQANDDRNSINLDLQTLNGLVADADTSANSAAGSATTASNMADAVAQATDTYTTVSAGLAATVDTNYFRVIEAPEAERVSVYRNDAGAATLITTYYTKTGVDAKQAAAVRLNRSLQRLGDNGQTLHSDFNLNAYGLGSANSQGVENALEAGELLDIERATGKLALQKSGFYEDVPVNTVARQWNPDTGEYGALIEPSATNELLYSTQFDNAAWTKTRSTLEPITSDSVIGEGYKLIASNDTNTTHALGQVTPVFTGPSTAYLIGKAAEYSNIKLTVLGGSVQYGMGFNLSNGSTFSLNLSGVLEASEGEAVHLGDGWYLCYIVVDVETANEVRVFMSEGSSHIFTGDGTSGIYIAHAQREQGTRPTSPIITTDAPVTRAADVPKRMLGSEWDNTAGTFVIETHLGYQNSTPGKRIFDLVDGTGQNSIEAFYRGSGAVGLVAIKNATTVVDISPAGVLPDGRLKLAVSFNAEGINVSGNGGGAISAPYSEMLDLINVLNTINIGVNETGMLSINGTVISVIYYPYSMTNTQLQEATTL